MALSVYTPTGIVHETSVDFTKRVLTEPVHLVQYDESLPVVAVTCLDAGQYMTLTVLDTVSIRMDKGDGTFIYNPALGMSADGHIVYIQITLQMTANYGRFEPVLELLRDGGYGASSPIPLFIDANPVPNSEIQSTSQWESLNDIVARANAIVAGDAVEFTEAETRENINSGENLITMFGKIKKWFTDFGAAAWKDSTTSWTDDLSPVNNTSDTATPVTTLNPDTNYWIYFPYSYTGYRVIGVLGWYFHGSGPYTTCTFYAIVPYAKGVSMAMHTPSGTAITNPKGAFMVLLEKV